MAAQLGGSLVCVLHRWGLARPRRSTCWSRSVGQALLLAGLLSQGVRLHASAISREVWNNIAGTDVALLKSDPRYPNSPSSSNLVTDFFESPTNVADNYGQRMHGYIVPPKTGAYTFWIATDDAGEL